MPSLGGTERPRIKLLRQELTLEPMQIGQRNFPVPAGKRWKVLGGGMNNVGISRETLCLVADGDGKSLGWFLLRGSQAENKERNFPNNVVDEEKQNPPQNLEAGGYVGFLWFPASIGGEVFCRLEVEEYDL